MNDNVLRTINKDREKVEAAWVFSLWKEPTLYSEYENIKSDFLKNKDAVWYYSVGKKMYEEGYKVFDNLSVETFLKDYPETYRQYQQYGGYSAIEELKSIVNVDNKDAFFDQISKMNYLSVLYGKYNELFDNVERFNSVSTEDVYATFEALNNAVALSNNEKVDNLVITDEFIKELESGDEMGYSFNRNAPLLNYITLGAAPGLFMIGGHSGVGKSSFGFYSMLMSLHHNGINTAVISNEMGIKTYKILLIEYILTQELNYWSLTRKQLRIGKFTDEQKHMLEKAKQISKEKFSNIRFIRMFSNDAAKIIKHIKRLKNQYGVSVILYDTFKSDDSSDATQQMWQTLLRDSRRLDSECRRLDVCCITSYQLALHTVNQRYLDATCLSNAKQIKEVYETMVYFRVLWDDEYTGEKYDVKPWKFSKENSKVKIDIDLDKNKKYLLAFIDKTRSDEDKQVLIYEWAAHMNVWKELGFAKVVNNHERF